MKNLSIYLLSTFFILTSCNKLDELTQFNIDYDTEVNIPSSTVVDFPIDVGTPDIKTNSESKFESNNTRKDLIEEVTLTKMSLNLKKPDDGTLNFLKSISVYIKADGVEEMKIAWKDDIPESIGKTLDLNTSEDNLKEYIKKESYSLRVTTVTDEVITTDHTIDVNSNFFIDAKLFGL